MPTMRMPNINQVAISGRLTRDPEFLYVKDRGSSRLNARVSVVRSYKNRNGEWQEEISVFDIVLWGRAADIFSEELYKDTPVFLTGRLRSANWKDSEGVMQSKTQIHVRNLQILGRDEEEENIEGEE